MAKRKDAPSSVLTRSRRETSTRIQASTNTLNTRKSPRFNNQMGPTPSSTVKKKPEKSEKQMGSIPLRRSGRGKNPVDVPASDVKSTKKSVDISEESAEDGSRVSNGGCKKRKRYHAVEFKARYKSQRVRVETEGSEVLAHIESPSSSGHQFWSAAVGNGTPVTNETPVDKETANGNASSLYQHLKPTLSELCNILKFSEGAKTIVGKFLTFVVGNFNVSSEHTNILQALMISVCWICSSLSKQTIDRGESFALAKQHLNFSCKEEEANQVYEKLKKTKEMFLQIPKNLKVFDAFKDRALRPEEPRMSPTVSPYSQEQRRENHGSSSEEALQRSGILDEDIARKERNEIHKFHSEWDEKKMNIVNDFRLEKALSNDMVSGSHTSENRMTDATAGADATVLSEPIGYIPAKDDADMGNDVVGVDATVSSKPIGDDAAPHVDFSADGSDAVEEESTRDTTPSVQQVVSPVSDHSMPPIPDIHNEDHLLQQPSKNGIQDQEGQADPSVMVKIEDDNMQPVEVIQAYQIIPEDSSLNPHDEPSSVMSANPTVIENQAAMLPTSEVLAQTTAAQTIIQNASLLEQYIFALQRNANSNQVNSQMTRRVDPLHIELEHLSSVKEKMVKSYHDNIQRIYIDCEKEIAEAIVEIRMRHCNKHQEAEATFNLQKREVENNMNTVVKNQVLAAAFRHKCRHASRGCAVVQQAIQAESMQQQHRFRGPSTFLPGQFSGKQQAPSPIPATAGATSPQRTQPPLQIVHRPSDLFLTPLTKHPHTSNRRPASTTPITEPPNTETCGQSHTTTPRMRPLVIREIQTPGPHMRPLANSDVGSGTYHRTLPVQHVTSSVPLTSPSSSQQLNSTSSVQPLPPLLSKPFLVPPPPQPRSESPHASVATSAHSSLPRGPSVPQSRRPQDKLNDNVYTLTYNAARALNILKTPEFQGGGNAAQPPAHEVVYLSDDDIY